MIRFGARSDDNEAEDAETFDLGKTASKSEVEAEVRRAGNRTTLFLVLTVGVLSVGLVTCIAASVGAYWFFQNFRPAQGPVADKKAVKAPDEIKARIKEIDRKERSINFLVGTQKFQRFQITDDTEFFGADGQRLDQGLESPELREGDDVVILPADDRESLKWLKLRP